MRDLFTVPDNYIMCGHDASGLEARMMAHYSWKYDDGVFANEILHGDIHSKNAEIFGVSRDVSKNGYYCLIYGGQAGKLASTINVPRKRANQLFNDFWEKNYALGELRKRIITMAENKGWIIGLDGRKIYIRSSHSALNALFQSAGAIVMKNSMVILDHWAKKEGLDFKKLLDQHDESQAELPTSEVEIYEVDTEEESKAIIRSDQIWMQPAKREGKWITGYSRYGELAVESIRRSGTYLGLRCPLDAEYKLGRSWAETH